MDDVVEELRCFLCCRLDERLVLDPLGEFVNSDINPSESTGGILEWPNHVQSPACERPRGGNHLQSLSWNVDLFGKKLATLTPSDKCFGVCYC